MPRAMERGGLLPGRLPKKLSFMPASMRRQSVASSMFASCRDAFDPARRSFALMFLAMLNWRRRLCWLLVLSLGRVPGRASADEAAGHAGEEKVQNTRRKAAAHFERGYELIQRADYSAAAVEFRRAYDSDPEPSVLFNLGQAHAAAGETIAAYDALAAFLEGSGPDIEPTRRRAAEQLMRVADERIGRLWIEVEQDGADIEVDGQFVGKAPLGEFRRFLVGLHAVVARSAENQTSVVNVTVRGRRESQIFLSLQPRIALARGVLFLYCAVPGVTVSIDEENRGEIPGSGFVAVPAGSHSLVLERSGYETERVTFRVDPGASHHHRCAGRVDAALDPAHASTLVVATLAPWADATLYVDGRPFRGSTLLLPSGRHLVEVLAPQAERWAQAVDLAPGRTGKLEPSLVPTAAYMSAASERERVRKLWTTVSLGTGLTFTAAATTLAWIGSRKREAWTKERDALDRQDLAAEGVAQRLYANSREALEIRSVDQATWGAALLGGGALMVSGYLWLSAADAPGQGAWSGHAGRSAGWIEYTGEF
jgi:hypothetical protein